MPAGRATARRQLASRREAVTQYRRALRFVPDDQPLVRAELLDRLGDELAALDRWAAGIRGVARSRSGSGTTSACPSGRAMLARRLTYALWRTCRGPESVAAAADRAGGARAAGSHHGAGVGAGHLPRAMRCCARTSTVARPWPSGRWSWPPTLGLDDVRSDALNTLACVAAWTGDEWYEPAAGGLRHRARLGTPRPGRRAYTNLVDLLDRPRAGTPRPSASTATARLLPRTTTSAPGDCAWTAPGHACLLHDRTVGRHRRASHTEPLAGDRPRRSTGSRSWSRWPLARPPRHAGRLGAARRGPGLGRLAGRARVDRADGRGAARRRTGSPATTSSRRAYSTTSSRWSSAAPASGRCTALVRWRIDRHGRCAEAVDLPVPYLVQLAGAPREAARRWDDARRPYDAALALLELRRRARPARGARPARRARCRPRGRDGPPQAPGGRRARRTSRARAGDPRAPAGPHRPRAGGPGLLGEGLSDADIAARLVHLAAHRAPPRRRRAGEAGVANRHEAAA